MPKIDKDWNPGRATQFSSTNQPKGRRGRKPKLKSIPDDAKEKVMEALFHALTLPDKTVVDMELAYIAAFGFEKVVSVKFVSDNLNLKQYDNTLENGKRAEP